MATVSEALAQYLEDEGHGTLGTDLWVDWWQDSPDVALSVHEQAGALDYQFSGLPGMTRVRIQLLGRHQPRRSRDALLLITPAYKALADQTELVSDGLTMTVMADTAPFLLERDASERTVYAVNFDVWLIGVEP